MEELEKVRNSVRSGVPRSVTLMRIGLQLADGTASGQSTCLLLIANYASRSLGWGGCRALCDDCGGEEICSLVRVTMDPYIVQIYPRTSIPLPIHHQFVNPVAQPPHEVNNGHRGARSRQLLEMVAYGIGGAVKESSPRGCQDVLANCSRPRL